MRVDCKSRLSAVQNTESHSQLHLLPLYISYPSESSQMARLETSIRHSIEQFRVLIFWFSRVGKFWGRCFWNSGKIRLQVNAKSLNIGVKKLKWANRLQLDNSRLWRFGNLNGESTRVSLILAYSTQELSKYPGIVPNRLILQQPTQSDQNTHHFRAFWTVQSQHDFTGFQHKVMHLLTL